MANWTIFLSTGEYQGTAEGADARAALTNHATRVNRSGGTPPLTFFDPDSFRGDSALGAVAEHTFGRRGGIQQVAYVARPVA